MTIQTPTALEPNALTAGRAGERLSDSRTHVTAATAGGPADEEIEGKGIFVGIFLSAVGAILRYAVTK
ncbi:MAG: hypothetical protein ACRDV9_14220, partial [Acidimicrobiia bacterium]